ncbi:hypothetical protein PFISCL1PPCAC_21532, partial [Pristionchus fissidentatus]
DVVRKGVVSDLQTILSHFTIDFIRRKIAVYAQAEKTGCIDHVDPKVVQCPCGEKICLTCVKGLHAEHFQYANLCAVDAKMSEQMKQIKLLRQYLLEERRESAGRKSEIENSISVAKNEISFQCSLIIAQ